ncbi:hypothetical protein GW915_02330 [bacterium]|nr:hypothetical protein [bacterium]
MKHAFFATLFVFVSFTSFAHNSYSPEQVASGAHYSRERDKIEKEAKFVVKEVWKDAFRSEQEKRDLVSLLEVLVGGGLNPSEFFALIEKADELSLDFKAQKIVSKLLEAIVERDKDIYGKQIEN